MGLSEVMNSPQEIQSSDPPDIGLSYALDVFKEYNGVHSMIQALPVDATVSVVAEKRFDTLKTILDIYQEQPHLLDPYIEKFLNNLLMYIRDKDLSEQVHAQAFKYLWLFTKVRGYKIIAKKLPHEIKDLQPVLQLLENSFYSSDFHASYVLLLWMSIIVYMPFNMMGFDQTVKSTDQTTLATVERIYSVIKFHLNSRNSTRDMAAYLASKFVTRLDLKDKYLPDFIDYCFGVLKNSSLLAPFTLFHELGALRSLGLIFKHGKREEIKQYSADVLHQLIELKCNISAVTPIRKLATKLIQRIGLTFLRPQVTSWRYQRGSRSLAINVYGQSSQTSAITAQENICEVEYDIPDEIEEVVDYLLVALKDEDSIVRWSAAKGIGRVTSRLPKELADDVVGAVLEMFTSRESDKAWHGGCLALAELARRGLLLPERLSAVIPVIERALVYDELRGQCSVGSNIRDAACYCCWAFARAYHPDEIKPYVERLATGLLIVSLFDREIPCRRAGSAAFQENVGRQGTFPHGIEILTKVDYFAVGSRSNAYLLLSMEVGKYPEYTECLINHLVKKKVGHWDANIRELSAKALHNLTSLSSVFMSQNILPLLLDNCTNSVLITRHGSILAVGHIVHALALEAAKQRKYLSDFINEDLMNKIKQIVAYLDEHKLFRGIGGEFMKQACCVLIEKCSLAQLPLHSSEVLDIWHSLLEDCFIYVEENIRAAALKALSPFWSEYYKITNDSSLAWRDNLVSKYVHGLKSDKETTGMGYVSALGCLPKELVSGKFDVILSALLDSCKITSHTATWGLYRKEIINTVVNLVNAVGISPDGNDKECLCRGNIFALCNSVLNTLDDYTKDRRGDIGAWVREASLNGLQVIITSLVKVDPSLVPESVVIELMPRICQQAVERIDRTRKIAGNVFALLLHYNPEIPHIPHVEEVRSIFPASVCNELNWASERQTFTLFVELIRLSTYRERMLLGFCYSLGGMTVNIDDRVSLSVIRSLESLLTSTMVLDPVLEASESLVSSLLQLLKKECFKCKDTQKLSAAVSILCELLRLESSSLKSILLQLSIFLGFQYPKIRSYTASRLLESLQDYSDKEIIPEEHLSQVISILENTPWMESTEEARLQRNEICKLLELPIPKIPLRK